MYSSISRPSIPPERLLKAQLLIALYSVRSERQFCERLDYDLLFRFLDFHGEKRSNETHESTTDPEAKLARKGSGKESKLSCSGTC